MMTTIIVRVKLPDGRWRPLTWAQRAGYAVKDLPKKYDTRWSEPDGTQRSHTHDRLKDAKRHRDELAKRLRDHTYGGLRPMLTDAALDGWLVAQELRVKEDSLRA